MTTLSSKRAARPVPLELRASFLHLYLDIAWFGVLSGSAMAFVSVYATRLGATALQIGLITAGPAIINLIFTLPAGQWLERKKINRAVFWAAVLHRVFYLPWVFLPLLLLPQLQLWTLIALTLLMSIPGTALAVGFNALFADAVPVEWRSHVTGIRNALLSVAFILASLASGFILDRAPFPAGYQIVFAIGFLGAVMSSIHLAFVRPAPDARTRPRTGQWLGDLAAPGRIRAGADNLRLNIGLRLLARHSNRTLMRVDILRGPFGRVVGVLFFFHLTQYLAIPLFPLAWVNHLGFGDDIIAWGQALFYAAVFIGSTQLTRVAKRLGNQRVTALGVMLLALYPLFTAGMRSVWLFMAISILGGLAWSLVGGSMANYILERAPEHDRPAHLAWYNMALNAAILLGSLGGPLIAQFFGLTAALLAAALGRFVAGVLVWRRG